MTRKDTHNTDPAWLRKPGKRRNRGRLRLSRDPDLAELRQAAASVARGVAAGTIKPFHAGEISRALGVATRAAIAERDADELRLLIQLRDDAKAIVLAGELHADLARRHLDDRDVQDADDESDGEELMQ